MVPSEREVCGSFTILTADNPGPLPPLASGVARPTLPAVFSKLAYAKTAIGAPISNSV